MYSTKIFLHSNLWFWNFWSVLRLVFLDIFCSCCVGSLLLYAGSLVGVWDLSSLTGDQTQPSHPLPTLSSFLLRSMFPSIRSFPMSQLFTLDGQSIGASASASVLPMNIQGWFPLGLTGLFSLQFKGLSRVFPSTTNANHQFFGAHLSLWSNSHIHTWLLEKP